MTIHHDGHWEAKMPSVAITMAGIPCDQLGMQLRSHGIIASAGFQCSPQAHHALGTAESGVVRLSFGPTSVAEDAERAAETMQQIASAS